MGIGHGGQHAPFRSDAKQRLDGRRGRRRLARVNPRASLPLAIVLFLPAAALGQPSANPSPIVRTESLPGGTPGAPIRRARTGHVSNYDEAKVGSYSLPDPLVLNDGEPVRDAATWFDRRRPELLEFYREDIFGRVPADAPKATVIELGERAAVDREISDAGGMRKDIELQFGHGAAAVRVPVTEYLPARRRGPVPVILHVTFHESPKELAPIPLLLSRGYGYAYFRYTDLQPDARDTRAFGIEALCAAPGEPPAGDEWGTISVWAWGASRVLDALSADPAIDAHRVILVGHSRLGKTVLWAGAQDPRFALVFSSCAGEMGSSLARRDYGETVDDMAQNFPYQFARNFQRYAGHWNDLPVDTHMVIALNAPHPVFLTGGTLDQWADPRGEFLAEVAASRVYRLLGLPGIGTTRMPGPDRAVMTGDLAFRYHRGPHEIAPGDWPALLAYADARLRATPK